MARVYSSEPSNIKPAKINKETLAAIGRLIRAFAEIEDLITLHISQLARMSEGHAIVLLGRTPMSKRLEIAEYLARATGENVYALHNAIFNVTFREALGCRNAVAHGKLLGKTQANELAFLTAKTEVPTGRATMVIVESFRPDDIMAFAKMAERAVPLIEERLMLQALRQARLRKPLSPHPKGQPQRTSKKK